MGFVAGLGHPGAHSCGIPTYYLDTPGGNIWDANTYLTIVLDITDFGSNTQTAITNAATGSYFSSGSAAGGDGVKAQNTLVALLQDIYATGGIEGYPDYNTNNATNGKTELQKHFQFEKVTTERPMLHLNQPHKYNSTGTWPDNGTTCDWDDSGFSSPSNFIQVAIGNESHPDYTDNVVGSNWGINETVTANFKSDINGFRAAIQDNGTIDDHGDATDPSIQACYIDLGYSHSHTFPPEIAMYGTGLYPPEGTTLGVWSGSAQKTASQALFHHGVILGEGNYAADAVDAGQQYNLVDFNTLTAWNEKSNSFHNQFHHYAFAIENQDYFYGALKAAITYNMSLP
jgi:hypothetical protein